MTGPALADYAHSYVFQTLADLGLLGVALSLAVAIGWGFAAHRATGPLRPRAPAAASAERIGLLTLSTVVITFAVHSAIDWTWFVPGDAVIALLCAGWVAGRGPAAERHPRGRPSLARLAGSPVAAATAAGAIALALVIAWSQWQPLRSQQVASAGADALASGNVATARADELTAIARNPLDITPLIYLGDSYAQAGKLGFAQATFERAVALQPSNAASWKALWQFDRSWSYDLTTGSTRSSPRSTSTPGTRCSSSSRSLPPRSSDGAARAVLGPAPGELPLARRHHVDHVVDDARADPLGRADHAVLAEPQALRDRATALIRHTGADLHARQLPAVEGMVERRTRRWSSCPLPGGRRPASSRCSSTVASSRSHGSRRPRRSALPG